MPSGLSSRLLARGLGRVPGLRRLPVFKLIALAEVAVLARDHLGRLTPVERRRLLELVRLGRGRGSRLPDADRRELAALLGKLDLRAFGGQAADRLSPVPLPRRLVGGRRGS